MTTATLRGRGRSSGTIRRLTACCVAAAAIAGCGGDDSSDASVAEPTAGDDSDDGGEQAADETDVVEGGTDDGPDDGGTAGGTGDSGDGGDDQGEGADTGVDTDASGGDGAPSRSSATPLAIDYLGLDIVITDLWTELVTERSSGDEFSMFGFPDDVTGFWVARASVDARALVPGPDDDEWTHGPFDLATLAMIDDQGRLFRLFPPDPSNYRMSADEHRTFEYLAVLPEAIDLSTVDLAVFNGDEDWMVAQRTLVPLDGSWAQGPSEIELPVGQVVAVHDDGYADDGQMTILGAQLGRNAGLYVYGDYDYGNAGDYRTSFGATGNFGLFDAPHGWLWLSVQLQYDKIEVPGIDPGTYLPDLDVLVDGVLLPQSVDWDQPLIGRDEVGALDEVSFLIPADTELVTFADRFAGELVPMTEVVVPALPPEWAPRFAPASSRVDGSLRLYSGDSLCAHLDLDEIEAVTGGTWASTAVSADGWTIGSAEDGSFWVECLISVTMGDGGAAIFIRANSCQDCTSGSSALTRTFDGAEISIEVDSYSPGTVSDDALEQLLDLAVAPLQG